MSDARQPPTEKETIADTIESALNGALEFLGRILTTLWTVVGRLTRAQTTRRSSEPAHLVRPLPLLLLCSFPYVLLQWSVVDVWYDRHATDLARPFLRSLLSSAKFGTSIPATIILTLPIVAIVIAARAVLTKLLRVEEAKRTVFQAAITDGFALQFILAALTHALCFGAAVLASVAQYLWPTGLLGEPTTPNEWHPSWLPFVWIFGALISAFIPPVSVLTTFKAISTTHMRLRNAARGALTFLVCGAASFFSLYLVYIAQLVHKGTDLLERRAVTTTCGQVVVRVADNVLGLRLLAEASLRGGATNAAPSSNPAIELTLVVNNGSARTLIFSRRLGRLMFRDDAKPRTSEDDGVLVALYLKPAEVTVVPPGAVSAIPVSATLSSLVAFDSRDVQSKLRAAVIEYHFSFVGQAEEFRYHGEWPTSHCKASFRASAWVVRSAEPMLHE